MDILKLIKNRKTIRKYKNKPIPKKIVDKIIEAGIWGPSIVVFQPWLFVVISNRKTIKKITRIIFKKVNTRGVLGTRILNHTGESLANSNLVIAVYNTKAFVNFSKRFGKEYAKFAVPAEFSAVSATIQNMILVAEHLGVGSCWHDTPLMCEKEINAILDVKDDLVALLSFGFPAEKGRRAARKPISEMIRYIK